MRWSRRLGAVLVAAALAGSLTACGERETAVDDLRAIVREAEQLSYKYSYEEQASGRKVEVRGIVEDDFRYKAQVAIDGKPAYEEVVSDDAVAARLLDPAQLGFFVREELAGKSADDYEAGAVALQSQRWVVDRTGAPSLLATGREERKAGDDWIIDSLTVFRYLEIAMREQPTVLFNRESLDYRESDDPFPHPAKGVERYDILPFDLPRQDDVSGGNQAPLGPQHFRKIAVYVKGDRIIEVREAVDIANRLDDMERNFGVEFDDSRSVDENVKIAVQAINTIRTGQGNDPLRLRTTQLRLTDVGHDSKVSLPLTDSVDATLGFLKNRGFAAETQSGSDESEEGDEASS